MRLTCVSLNSCVDRVLAAENFRLGSHCQAVVLAEQPAGKAVNVARILAALGVATRLVALVGEDRREFFRRHLARQARLQAKMVVAAERTRQNTTILDQRARAETHIREKGEALPARSWRALVSALTSDRGDWLVFCGSLPPGLETGKFADLLRRLRRGGKKIMVDSSGSALAAAVHVGVDLIKPNRGELAELLGKNARQAQTMDVIAAAVRLRRSYPGLAILASDGENGACFVSAEGSWHAVAKGAFKVISTVGAGDALLAGFLQGMAKRESPAKCLRRAVLVATTSLVCPAAGKLDLRLLRGHRRLRITLNAMPAASLSIRHPVRQSVFP